MVLQALQLLQSGFEGCEKKLEIDFLPTADLRSIPKTTWDVILAEARCSIVSQQSNEFFQTYLLSESSLFVYPHKIVIKTCGTTGLLHIISKLIDTAKDLGTEIDFVQYSRSNFMFPSEQPFPHKSFEMEVEYLNTFFSGSAYILGPLAGPRWHFYVADMNISRATKDQSIEMVMFDLPKSVMKNFFRSTLETEHKDVIDALADEVDDSGFGSKKLGHVCTKVSRIDTIVPSSSIDDFVFDPCGYSCNGLFGKSYYTIHITPEPECSFVSFDCNLPHSNFTELVNRVLDVFQPGRFCVQVFADKLSPATTSATSSEKGLSWAFDSYEIQDRTSHEFKGGYTIGCAHFNRKNPVCEDLKELVMSTAYSMPHSISHGLFEAIYDQVSVKRIARRQFEDSSDLVADFVSNQSSNDPFFIVDFGAIVKQVHSWREMFPDISPYYNVNCNSDSAILALLGALGCGFCCSSVDEVRSLTSIGISAERILFSRPFKSASHIQCVRDCEVGLITVDSQDELETIKKFYPQAKLLVRVCVGGGSASRSKKGPRSSRFRKVAIDLKSCRAVFEKAQVLEMDVVGLSCCISVDRVSEGSYGLCLDSVQEILKISRSYGFEMSYIDFESELIPGDCSDMGCSIKNFREDLKSYGLDSLTLIAKPSSYLVRSSHTLAVNVIARRGLSSKEGKEAFLYYVNEGLYGCFNCLLYEDFTVKPIPVSDRATEDSFPCTIFGPTCDSIDCIAEHAELPKMEVGDWMYFPDMGAYTVSGSTAFNGFGMPKSHYVFTI